MRSHFDKVDVQTLIAVTIFTQAFALQVFEIDPPAMLWRQVRCEFVHRPWRSFADTGDVLLNLGRQASYVMRIPSVFFGDNAAFGERANMTPKQKT